MDKWACYLLVFGPRYSWVLSCLVDWKRIGLSRYVQGILVSNSHSTVPYSVPSSTYTEELADVLCTLVHTRLAVKSMNLLTPCKWTPPTCTCPQ